MNVQQYSINTLPLEPTQETDLVFIFSGEHRDEFAANYERARTAFPCATIVGCSTAGEIEDTKVTSNHCVVTAVTFKNTSTFSVCAEVTDIAHSKRAGAQLAQKLLAHRNTPLKHIFVLSDGLNVNGSELVAGLVESVPSYISATGGLAGDNGDFTFTQTIANGAPKTGQVVAVGFYGDAIHVGHGCMGGWDPFGTERLITRSQANVLYELDGKPALQLYKQYLGEHAQGLPSTGLLFPLTIREEGSNTTLVRTILGVDEKDQSVTFAGNVPTGQYARFMKANFSRLVSGAENAANESVKHFNSDKAELAVLVSCVGRKMILKQRTEEEVEAVRSVLGPQVALTGFYSYGEISPHTPTAKCELHNQTMTITTFWEE